MFYIYINVLHIYYIYIYIFTHIDLVNSAVTTRLEKISFHSNSKEGQCQRIVQTTVQLNSFHMIVQLCSKSFKLGFNST